MAGKGLPSPWILRRASRHLRRGGIVAHPTEAVYGLACDPANPIAVAKLLGLKRRSAAKGLILIAAEFEALSAYLQPLPPPLQQQVLSTWPGPVTWLLPARPQIPSWLRGAHSTLAVRVTAHPLAAALCRAFGGPLVSTSANRSGLPPAKTALGVRRQFLSKVLVVAGATGGCSRPTAIVDALSGRRLR